MECARVQFVSRCGGETSNKTRDCASFAKTNCTMARSSRRVAAAAAREPHARAPHARTGFRPAHGTRQRA
eukprot:11214470-Lingulodinium_polyedra.AAC.1